MSGKLVHFDIPVDDVAKAVAFYKAVMSWKIEKYEGSDMGDMEYWMIMTEPDNEEGLGGGIGKKSMPQQTPLNYYDADGGLAAFNQRVKDNGGSVMMEKMPVPGMGYFSVCLDPEGNAFGGWETDEDAKM